MKIKLKYIVFTILALTSSFLVYFWGKEYIMNYLRRMKLNSFDEPKPGSKILIVAPHCDDETLGTGELISKLVKKNVDFRVVLMTNGDGFTDALDIAFHEIRPKKDDYIRFGYFRQNESKTALNNLGLSSDKIIFLGYPDGGLYNMWSVENWTTPYQSIHTGRISSPYINSYNKNTFYTGQNIINDLKSIINNYKPDYIFYPHPNDRHHDHLASYCITKYALNSINLPIKEYLYLVHRGDWPIITANYTKLYLIPPYSLNKTGAVWYGYYLSEQETLQKLNTINKYKSQVSAMGPRLRVFARKNELYASYPNGILKKSNIESHKYNEFLLEYDPTSDVLPSTIQSGGDLKALYGYQNVNNSLNLYLESKGGIKPEVRYILDIIMFNKSTEINRLTISVNEGKYSALLFKNNSITKVTDINYSARGTLLDISIPGKYMAEVNRCFIGATSSISGVRLDNMAWKMYDISAQ